MEHKAQIPLVEIPKGIMMIQTYTSLYIQLLTQIQASTIHGGFGLSEGRKASVPMPFQTKSDKHHTIPVTNDPQSVSPQMNPPDALASSQNDHHPCRSRHPVSAQSDLCEALFEMLCTNDCTDPAQTQNSQILKFAFFISFKILLELLYTHEAISKFDFSLQCRQSAQCDSAKDHVKNVSWMLHLANGLCVQLLNSNPSKAEINKIMRCFSVPSSRHGRLQQFPA